MTILFCGIPRKNYCLELMSLNVWPHMLMMAINHTALQQLQCQQVRIYGSNIIFYFCFLCVLSAFPESTTTPTDRPDSIPVQTTVPSTVLTTPGRHVKLYKLCILGNAQILPRIFSPIHSICTFIISIKL